MKNAINYYYNLVTYDIRRVDKKYRFTVDDNEYLLILCEYNPEELEEIYKLSTFLLQMNIYVHQIILNTSNQIVTMINNEPYILMRLFVLDNRKVTVKDLKAFENLPMYNYFPRLRKNNWREFWIRKIDYFEYQIRELGTKYSIIKESFCYFVGMTETAISLLYDFNYDSNFVIAHKRITSKTTLQDLYNPLNFVIDNKVRDVSSYFKNGFFDSKVDIKDIIDYLNSTNLTREDLYLFYVRMLFPSYYFDLYEDIISGHCDEEKLLGIINKIDNYQALLHDLYWLLKPYANLPDIEWIIKTQD